MSSLKKPVIADLGSAAVIGLTYTSIHSHYDNPPVYIYAFVPIVYVAFVNIIRWITAWLGIESADNIIASRKIQREIDACREGLREEHASEEVKDELKSRLNKALLAQTSTL